MAQMSPNDAMTHGSLCDTCQRPGKDCSVYDPQAQVDRCADYRQWTQTALRSAQTEAARADSRGEPSAWGRLVRLIEIEERLCL